MSASSNKKDADLQKKCFLISLGGKTAKMSAKEQKAVSKTSFKRIGLASVVNKSSN
jgi:hypothetical protein